MDSCELKPSSIHFDSRHKHVTGIERVDVIGRESCTLPNAIHLQVLVIPRDYNVLKFGLELLLAWSTIWLFCGA